jgi:hypothetical protein
MKYFRLSSIFVLTVLFLFPSTQTFAHGGGHKPENEQAEEPVVVDSMYSVKESETDSMAGETTGLDNMFSPMDLFTETELVLPDPMPMGDMKMEGSHNEHQEPMVELSHHEPVSSSSKGYGAAVGITLFAGVAFAGLTFMRPGGK